MSRPLLLYVTDTEGFGGAEGYLRTLLLHADTSRFRLGLALPPRAATRPLADVAEARGGAVAALEGVHREGLDPRRIRAAYRLFRRLRPSVVHFVLPSPRRSAEAVIGAALARVPVRVATFQLVTPVPRFAGLPGALRAANRALQYRTLTHAVAVSRGNRTLLVEQYGVPAGRLALIPNAVDAARFAPREPDPAYRAHWGVPPGAPLIGIFGRLSRQKGHRALFEAMPLVWRALPEARLVVAGAGELETELRALAGQDRAGRIRLLGQLDDMPAALAAADVVALPSLYEGMPFAALEAMAMARAVVASEVDGTREVVDHGRTGLLVPPSDPPALAEALLRLLGDPGLRAEMGRAARARVLERYEQREMLARTFALYAGLQ